LITIKISAEQIDRQNDWRPSLYLRGGAVLRRLGDAWPCLGDLADSVVDGWRGAPGQTTGSFDAVAESTPLYRLRHIGPCRLETESFHYSQPQVSGQPYCVQPLDIVIKKVGGASAALVSEVDSRHPVDANLVIVRGLPSQQAVWVCFCLNQSLYQDYLNEPDGISALVRLGLKKLRRTPIHPIPDNFAPLAQAFLGAYGRLAETRRTLARLRTQVNDWLIGRLDDFNTDYWLQTRKSHWNFFNPGYIDGTLHINQVEQNYLRDKLIEQYRLLPLTDLAVINPTENSSGTGEIDKILQINSITDSLTLKSSLTDRNDNRWRFQKRQLRQGDVVMSTFVINPRVAYLNRTQNATICPGAQVAVFDFYQYPAAYALLMESWLMKMQLRRLASGGGMRFIQQQQLSKLVLPAIDPETGAYWQQKIEEHHEQSHHADTQLTDILSKMTKLFNRVHGDAEKMRGAA
jgi:hypothetical protein